MRAYGARVQFSLVRVSTSCACAWSKMSAGEEAGAGATRKVEVSRAELATNTTPPLSVGLLYLARMLISLENVEPQIRHERQSQCKSSQPSCGILCLTSSQPWADRLLSPRLHSDPARESLELLCKS